MLGGQWSSSVWKQSRVKIGPASVTAYSTLTHRVGSNADVVRLQLNISSRPTCRYYRWRELIAVLSTVLTLVHGVTVLCPGFVPFLPPGRLTNPLLFVRLIGGEMQAFLGAFNRVGDESTPGPCHLPVRRSD